MRHKKLLIIALVIAFLLMLEIGIVSFWVFRKEQERLLLSAGRDDTIVRIGILPTISKKQSEKIWLPYLQAVDKFSKKIKLKPYFANSFEEIVIGFKHNVLDLAFINTALSQRLCKNDNGKLFACLVPENKAGYYAVILTKRGNIQFVKDTKQKRITFTNKNSIAGYQVPFRFLEKKIKHDLNEWFSEIRFAGNDNQAIRDLIQNKTDIAAVNNRALQYFLSHSKDIKDDFNVIWLFRNIPGNVICKNKHLNDNTVKHLKNILFHEKSMAIKDFLIFIPPDSQEYQRKLEAYNKFMND